MRKNLFFSLFATMVLLLTTACQKENDLFGNGEATISFEISTPQMATRAFSNGATATQLQYAVYDEQGNPIQRLSSDEAEFEPVTINEFNGKRTINIPLATGKKYNVLFWAASPNSPYEVDFVDKVLTVNYDETVCNSDHNDAFYSYIPVDVDGTKSQPVALKRPFAQLNIGTNDLGVKNEVDVTKTGVKVKGIYRTFNFATKQLGGNINKERTFALANRPVGENFKVAGYEYLAMAYVLVGNDQNYITDVTLCYGASDKTAKTREFTNIPVRGNHRTNLYGALLTSNVGFDVEIEEDFDKPDENIEVWDGKKVTEPKYDDETDTYTVSTGAELAWLAELVNGTTTRAAGNSLKGEKIVLTQDIDLGGNEWTPIGVGENTPFEGIFDGNGYTINNLNIVETEAKEGKAFIGFFGYAEDATIMNVTFTNVNLNIACLDIDHSQGHIGAVAGSLEGTSIIENVTVNGNIKVEATVTANGASRVAVVAGGNSYGNVTMKNVHVRANDGSYLKANNNVGALAGQLQGKSVFEDCSSNIPVTGTKFFAGGIIGLAAGDQTFTNCHTTGDVTITAGREGRAHDHYRVGGIAGGWADGAKNVCTLTGCTYTGALSGTNADGSVAEAFDYAGYVGRGYTLNGCAGSKVIIDGVAYVQAFNEAANAGIYYVDGKLVLSTAAALRTFAQKVNTGADYFEGKTIKLGADIDLNNEEWTPIGSAVKDHGFMGNFDGNGKTIKNLKIAEIALDADGYAYAGLFGVTEGVDKNNQNYIKNLTIENVNIDLDGDIVAAAIAYPYYTALENILVKGDVSIKGGDYTSGVLAYTRRLVDAKNIAITANQESVIEGNATIGGVISDIQTNGGLVANYSNFAASGLKIKGNVNVGGISGIISLQTLNGAKVENVAIECSDARKGIIAGSLGADSEINNVVVNNVTGANNYVGATYTAGSTHTVTIDGVDYEYLADGTIKVNGVIIIADGVGLNEAGEYLISNAAGMFWFANEVNVNKNAFSGKTVKLTADINLNNAAWTPIGQTGVATFNGIFDGGNYTISNLNVNSETQTGKNYSSGLFGWVESHTAGHGHLKNVNINGATIVGHHNCGALVGYITQETALVEKCHVTGANVSCTHANNDADGDKAGALIGNATNATPVKGCTASNSTVSAGRDAGQLIGAGREANVTNCSATNVEVTANGTGTGANVRNEVIGRLL